MMRIKTALIILLTAITSAVQAQVTKNVTYYNLTGAIADPTNFFPVNVLAGNNITIDLVPGATPFAGYKIRINGSAAGTGTNSLAMTNGVAVGPFGTLDFVYGITGYVDAGVIKLGVNVSGGPGGSMTNTSVMTNGVFVTSFLTNLNFVVGTNITPIMATNVNGFVSISFNVNSFGLTNGFVGANVTNGLATISYVLITSNNLFSAFPFLTTNANQFLGVPLSIKEFAYVTNLTEWNTGRLNAVIVTNQVFLGGVGVGSQLYSYDNPGAQYRIVLASGTSILNWGTNEHTHAWRGVAFGPESGQALPLASSSSPWSNGFVKMVMQVQGHLRASTNVEAANIIATNFLQILNGANASYTFRGTNTVNDTNVWWLAVSNISANQILKAHSVTWDAAGRAHVVWTNAADNAGGGGLTTNDTQFGASVQLTIKDGAFFTNIVVRSPNGGHTGVAIFNTNTFVITNGFVGIHTSTPNVHLALGSLSASDFPTIEIHKDTNRIYIHEEAIGSISSTPYRLMTGGGYRWAVGGTVASGFQFYPVSSNISDIGIHDFLVRSNYTKWLRAYDGIQITSESIASNSATFILTNITRQTNIFALSFSNNLSAGQAMVFHSVTPLANGQIMIVLTNGSPTATVTPGGIVGNIQVHGTGGTLVGSTNSFFDVTNNRVELGGDFRTLLPSGQGVINITNTFSGKPAILITGTNSQNRLNFLSIDDTGIQNMGGDSVLNGAAISFTFDPNGTFPMNGLANIGNGLVITQHAGFGYISLRPNTSLPANPVNLGTPDFPFNSNYFNNLQVYRTIVAGGFNPIQIGLRIVQGTGMVANAFEYINSNNFATIISINSNGFLMMTNFLTNYVQGGTRTTPTNTMAQGVGDFAGRLLPEWSGQMGLADSPQPSLFNNRIAMIYPGSGTSPGQLGTANTTMGGTTVSHPAVDGFEGLFPFMVALDTPATDKGVAGLFSTENLAPKRRLDGAQRVAGYFFAAEFCITNFEAQRSVTTNITFVGLVATNSPNYTNIVIATNGHSSHVGLFIDARTQTNMYISTMQGATQFRTNTGINFVASNIYQLYLFNSPTSRMINWDLRDLTLGLRARGWMTNHVPTNDMKFGMATRNGTNRAHQVRFSKLYLEAPISPQ